MADELLPNEILVTDDLAEDDQPAPKESGGFTAEMLATILRDQNALSERRVQEALAMRGQPLQQDMLPELDFKLDGLPDPAIDPMGFHKGYAQRAKDAVGAYVQAQIGRVQTQTQTMLSDQEIRNKALGLIREAAPDLPEDVIGFASMAVAQKLQADGRDPVVALRSDTEGVAQQILDYADDMKNRLIGEQPSVRRSSGGNVQRTGGMPTPRGRAQQPKQTRDEPDPQEFFKMLTAEQTKARIY